LLCAFFEQPIKWEKNLPLPLFSKSFLLLFFFFFFFFFIPKKNMIFLCPTPFFFLAFFETKK